MKPPKPLAGRGKASPKLRFQVIQGFSLIKLLVSLSNLGSPYEPSFSNGLLPRRRGLTWLLSLRHSIQRPSLPRAPGRRELLPRSVVGRVVPHDPSASWEGPEPGELMGRSPSVMAVPPTRTHMDPKRQPTRMAPKPNAEAHQPRLASTWRAWSFT